MHDGCSNKTGIDYQGIPRFVRMKTMYPRISASDLPQNNADGVLSVVASIECEAQPELGGGASPCDITT